MSQRDRQILMLGGVVAGILLFYLLLLRPLGNAIDDAEQRIDERRAAVQDMRSLAGEARSLRASLPKDGKDLNLLPYLEGIARQAQLNTNIEYMKPGSGVARGDQRRPSVELKLARVNLKQLTNLLFQIEVQGRYPLTVEEIHIKKRFDAPDLLDVTLEVYQG